MYFYAVTFLGPQLFGLTFVFPYKIILSVSFLHYFLVNLISVHSAKTGVLAFFILYVLQSFLTFCTYQFTGRKGLEKKKILKARIALQALRFMLWLCWPSFPLPAPSHGSPELPYGAR
jgi:hypothetical protein